MGSQITCSRIEHGILSIAPGGKDVDPRTITRGAFEVAVAF